MNNTSTLDYDVNAWPTEPEDRADDPFARLFFDHTVKSGIRLLAVAEPMQRTGYGYYIAAAALAAFEETLTVTIKDGAGEGIAHAFRAANDAVHRGNSRSEGVQRAYVGITAIVIDGQQATIGFVPPGQTLLMQDGQLYGIPDLATWEPGFMPCSDIDEPEPLGFASVTRPLIRNTQIGSGDQLLLGASSVGRALASSALGPTDELTESTIMNRVEKGLEASGIDDAYAAWIRCDCAPASTPIDADRMAEIERLWQTQSSQQSQHQVGDRFVDPKMRRAVRRDELRIKLIETSERVFGRREAECLPYETRRRATAPLGTASLHRYVSPHSPSLANWFRARLPRGLRLPHSRRSLAAMAAILVFVVALAITHNVRDTRAARQDRVLGVAKTEVLRASTATSREAAQPHIDLALTSLDKALDGGADPQVIAAWRNNLSAIEDGWNGVVRFSEMSKIGTIPVNLSSVKPQLILAGRDLFLIAGGVFLVRESDRQLIPLLQPGDRADGRQISTVISAAANNGRLVVTDGLSVFWLDESRRWSAFEIATSGSGSGWPAAATGISDDGYYLFSSTDKQVKRFDIDELDQDPIDWLDEKATKHTKHVIDMAVNDGVHLLTSDGTIYSFDRGAEQQRYVIEDAGDGATMVGLYGTTTSNKLFVVERDNNEGMLLGIDPLTGQQKLYLAPMSSQPNYDSDADEAFSETIDFVVDPTNHVAYFVTTDGLWRASFA